MDPGTARAGFVLAGGNSSRMGQDKARLPLHGKTLLEHVAAAVAEAAGSVTLVGAPERYRNLGFRILPDSHPGWGPLAGIHTALGDSSAAWNLIVACDMPLISAAFLQSLLDAAESSGADCLIPSGPSGRPEPLCAVYHWRCRDAIGAALDRNVRKVTDGLAGLRIAAWSVPESGCFFNVNTPEEWAHYLHG
jgi:molybdopterin-guanine dinucleotide biosynthesis protein A